MSRTQFPPELLVLGPEPEASSVQSRGSIRTPSRTSRSDLTSPSRSGRLQTSRSRILPIAQNGQPMTPPRPLVGSVLSTPSQTRSKSTPERDSTSPFRNEDRLLQHGIQSILDEHGAGLLAGLNQNGSPQDPEAETEPASHLDLHASRKRILHSLQAIANLRRDESKSLSTELQTRRTIAETLDSSSTKQTRLTEQIQTITREEEIATESFRTEQITLQSEIHELEDRLAGLKTRLQHVDRELTSRQSTIDAKLSSYKAALEDLQKETSELVKPLSGEVKYRSREETPSGLSSSNSKSVASPSRKLNLASSISNLLTPTRSQRLKPQDLDIEATTKAISQTCDSIGAERQRVEDEREHARQSVKTWTTCLDVLSSLEKAIQSTMSAAMQSEKDVAAAMGKAQELIDQAQKELQTHFDVVMERNWGVLKVALGAEIEALEMARQMLRSEGAAGGRSGELLDLGEQDQADIMDVESRRGISQEGEEQISSSSRRGDSLVDVDGEEHDGDDDDPTSLFLSP